MTSQPTKNILFQHNLNAYRAVTEAFRHGDRAAVVHATGTGKSYIIEAVAKDYGRAAVIAPNNYVLDELRRREIHADLLTYPTVMSMKTYPENRYDLIVLDEFHRAGAEWWGLGVACLLEANPEAKVLGTSATEIRYLDGARNMADELFEGNVVSRLPLTEAWLRGILPVPKYVVGLFNYEDTYKQYSRRISVNRRMSESDVRSAREILEKGRLKWETSHGVASIFRNHLPADTRRLIVFCDRTENLPDVQYRITQWLAEAGFRSCSYTVHYRNPESETDMADFRDDDPRETGVKVLFAIDMLNEGVHVPDVEAVVLLRPTCSKNVFLQQIGRCMNAGTEHQPVILDLVDNLTATSEVERLRDEYNAALKAAAAVNDTGREMKEFIVTDYVKDIRDLIYSVNAFRPSYTRDENMALLRRFVKENGRWPKNNGGPDERHAAAFASLHRTDPEVAALHAWAEEHLGTKPWRSKTPFEKSYAALSEFISREKRWPVRNAADPEERRLYIFAYNNLRAKYSGRLDALREEVVREYGADIQFIDAPGKVNPERLANELRTFLHDNGRWPSFSSEDPVESLLNQRADAKKEHPAVAAVRSLAENEYGVTFRNRRHSREERIGIVKGFLEENGRWPGKTKDSKEETYVRNILYELRNDPEILTLAESHGTPLPFTVQPPKIPFDRQFADLEAFVRDNRRWPVGGKKGNNPDLAERRLHSFARRHFRDPRIQTLLAQAEKEHGFKYNSSYDSAEMLARTEEFIRLNQRWPAASSKDKEEATLGYFLTREKKRDPEGFAAFSEKMNAAYEPKHRKTMGFEENLALLERFILSHKGWPRQDQRNGLERSLARFASRNKDLPEVIRLRELSVSSFGTEIRRRPEERVAELRLFIGTHGRWPKEKSDEAAEKSLAVWCSTHSDIPEVVSLKEADDRRRAEENDREFEGRLAELEAFIRRTGKWPTHHTDDRETYGWGYFVNMNRKDPRVIALKKHFRTKSDVLVTAPYEVRLKELRQFVTEKGRLPEWNATDPFEKGLYYVYISKKNKPRYREDMAAVAALAKEKTAT